MPGIQTLTIKGFKSIGSLENLEMRQLNVLIGPNGAGKSNFISFFKLLNAIVEERLQLYVGQNGGPDALLRYGRRFTSQIEASLRFGKTAYAFKLVPTVHNRLIFASEDLWEGPERVGMTMAQDAGVAESRALKNPRVSGPNSIFTEEVVRPFMGCRVYHVHDTSDVANIKRVGALNDNAFLRPDAGNLAAFLYRIQKASPSHYGRIREAVRLAHPGFDDFHLRPWPFDPSGNSIVLEWREEGSDYPFLANQLSDGTLRFISLATLLLQPQPTYLVLIDEPELGLHRLALKILAALLQSAAVNEYQLIVATQSEQLVDQLLPEDIITVKRSGGQSVFTRLKERN